MTKNFQFSIDEQSGFIAGSKYGTITPDGTKPVFPTTTFECKQKPAAAIDPCKSIIHEINSLKKQISKLQTELRKAPTPSKPELVHIIRALQAELNEKNEELKQCRINNSPPILN